MAQLTCQKLCVGYDGKPVLQDLDFEVFAGDYLCIVGENGSGKSTLMKTILGLQMPISGRILTGDGLRKNEIGYLPQQTVVQKDFPASVREIILSGCQGRCGSRPFTDTLISLHKKIIKYRKASITKHSRAVHALEEHTAIYTALAAHDGKAAAEAALRHVANARANIAGITQKGEN